MTAKTMSATIGIKLSTETATKVQPCLVLLDAQQRRFGVARGWAFGGPATVAHPG